MISTHECWQVSSCSDIFFIPLANIIPKPTSLREYLIRIHTNRVYKNLISPQIFTNLNIFINLCNRIAIIFANVLTLNS